MDVSNRHPSITNSVALNACYDLRVTYGTCTIGKQENLLQRSTFKWRLLCKNEVKDLTIHFGGLESGLIVTVARMVSPFPYGEVPSNQAALQYIVAIDYSYFDL